MKKKERKVRGKKGKRKRERNLRKRSEQPARELNRHHTSFLPVLPLSSISLLSLFSLSLLSLSSLFSLSSFPIPSSSPLSSSFFPFSQFTVQSWRIAHLKTPSATLYCSLLPSILFCSFSLFTVLPVFSIHPSIPSQPQSARILFPLWSWEESKVALCMSIFLSSDSSSRREKILRIFILFNWLFMYFLRIHQFFHLSPLVPGSGPNYARYIEILRPNHIYSPSVFWGSEILSMWKNIRGKDFFKCHQQVFQVLSSYLFSSPSLLVEDQFHPNNQWMVLKCHRM